MPTNLKSIVRALLSIVALAALALGTFAPLNVAAAEGTNPPIGDKAQQKVAEAYQRQLDWLELQSDRLTGAHTLAEKAQKVIDAALAKGKDVSGLVSALARFNTGLADAQTMHDQAAAGLQLHAGFDDSGKVTDLTAARQTVRDGRAKLAAARDGLEAAARDLRAALKAWRSARP